MESTQVLRFAESTKNNFVRKNIINERLTNISEAQLEILKEIAISTNEVDETERKIKLISKEMAEVDEQIKQGSKILNNLLCNPKSQSNECSDTLKAILISHNNNMMSICKETIDQKKVEISVFKMIELEAQISNLISNLRRCGLFTQSQSDELTSKQRIEYHNSKLLSFIKDIEASIHK